MTILLKQYFVSRLTILRIICNEAETIDTVTAKPSSQFNNKNPASEIAVTDFDRGCWNCIEGIIQMCDH